MKEYDAIVIGMGAMGSATAYNLARRGLRVLGIERYDIPNEMGSSHGVSRMIRLQYHEDPSYVPLVRRAYELWHQLELIAGERLLFTTGSVRAGPEGSSMFEGSREACVTHGIPHQIMTGPEVNRQYPGFRLPEDMLAVYQADGGFLLSERCIVAYVFAAMELGAEIHGREQVLGWEPSGDGVEVHTDRDTYRARKMAVCSGSWTSTLVPELAELAVPERQVLAWFQPLRPELFRLGTFPAFGLLVDEGRFYGFPPYGIPGFKVGRTHHRDQRVDPDQMQREPDSEDEKLLRDFTQRYFPDAAGPTMALKTCLFTNSPDEHFIIDLHPDYPQVAIAAGFSGHGFKFSSVIGEIMADLCQTGQSTHEMGLFRLDRLLSHS
jgi:sarcosine oxidase